MLLLLLCCLVLGVVTQEEAESCKNPQMKRVLVTGGSGFVGRVLVQNLIKSGHQVSSIGRSAKSCEIITNMGAKCVRADLVDEKTFPVIEEALGGVDTVYHLAARVEIEGTKEEFQKETIDSAANMVKWSKNKGVKTFVHCSTEQVLLGGPTIASADETWPYPTDFLGYYAWSKAKSEELVLKANTKEFRTVSIRPRLIWGRGDTVLLDKIGDAVKTGQWMWIGYGAFNTSTAHVQNVVHGLMQGAKLGHGGEAYFVSDGDPINFKVFMTKMLLVGADVDASSCFSVPQWVGTIASWIGMAPAPVVRLFGEECTVIDTKARNQIEYNPPFTIEQGLIDLEKWKNEKKNSKN